LKLRQRILQPRVDFNQSTKFIKKSRYCRRELAESVKKSRKYSEKLGKRFD